MADGKDSGLAHGTSGSPQLTLENGEMAAKAKENEAKIIIVDKTRYDTYFNKGRKTNFRGKVEKATKIMVHIIKWYI